MNFGKPASKQKLLEEQTKGTKITDYTDEELDDYKNKWSMNNRVIDLYLENIKQDQKLRSEYAEKLIKILAFELFVLVLIFIGKGAGFLNYSDSSLNIFITGVIAEVFILVRVIVKYLFKDNLTEAFKIIITKNNKDNYKKNNNKYKIRNKKSDKP